MQQTGKTSQENGPEAENPGGKLAALANALSTREALRMTIEIARELGVAIETGRMLYDERTIEIAGEASEGGERTIIETAVAGGHLRLLLTCLERLEPALVREIEAVARVAVLRAELCERRLWRGGEDHGPEEAPGGDTGMVARSESGRALEREIVRAARSPHSVLITGETGTGKTTAARIIHHLSARGARPFVEINCAAIPEALLESELFGFERGAFTGAVTSKRGQFEEADGGTLFLDEVGELTPAMQSKLLKVLEEKSVRRLGATRAVRCDVRLVAATSQNLQEMMKAGRFREDLYYRLEVLEIHTAPLRERREDIPLLLSQRLDREQQLMGHELPFALEESAVGLLCAYPWPGNIRQLQNVIAKLAAYTEIGVPITLEDVSRVLRLQARAEAEEVSAPLYLVERGGEKEITLPAEILRVRQHETLKQYLARVKVCAIEAARVHAGGSMLTAAQRLGVAYPTLNQGLKKARSNAA